MDGVVTKPTKLQGGLIGGDGNAFAVMGQFQRDARAAGWTKERISEVIQDATSKDYTHLLGVIMEQYEDPSRKVVR